MSDTAASPGRDSDWLVGRPSGVQVWAALWIGSVGLLILGLQPLLLGALLDERRVDLDQLGLIATAEIIAIGLGSALARMKLENASLGRTLPARAIASFSPTEASPRADHSHSHSHQNLSSNHSTGTTGKPDLAPSSAKESNAIPVSAELAAFVARKPA